MDAQVQAYKDALTEKSAAKEKALTAVGEAKLAELENRTADAETAWDTWATYGINGLEGELHAKIQQLADDYVSSHPEQVAHLQPYRDPNFRTQVMRDDISVEISGHEAIVTMISLARASGLEEASLIVDMFERASFERQQIGVAVQIVARNVNSGSGG